MTNMPFVSMIIVVKNGINYIENSVNSIINQSYPKNKIELIIVDGMSDDGSYEYSLKKMSDLNNLGHTVSCFRNPKKTLASGWNIAIENSKGEYVCRIDVHSELTVNYIQYGIKALLLENNDKVVAIGGWLQNNSGKGFVEKAIVDLLGSSFGVGNSPVRRPGVNIRKTDTVAYGIYKKNEVIISGLYDESMFRNQDIDLNYRLNYRDLIFLTHPEMKAVYYVRSTIIKLLIKSYNDGAWVLKTPGKKIRHVIPFTFVIYLIFLIINIFIVGLYIQILYLPLFIYSLCCFYFGLKKINKYSVLLITLFPLLHLSYGIGTLFSLFSLFPSKK
jgi:glycosyltransferase involved in cell wall biosynthesis